jgi:putative membrane protein
MDIMMSEPDNTKPDRSTELAEQRTDLATQRTIIAAERTLMAWIRTSISLIGFGFTIYQFFRYLRQAENLAHPHAARNLGLTLISLGVLALLVAALQHRIFLNQMGVIEGKHLWSLAFMVAILMMLIGIMAFIGVLTGAGPY